MTYLDRINYFYNSLPTHPLSAGAQALYMYLLQEQNRARSTDAFGNRATPAAICVAQRKIMQGLCIKSRNTLKAYVAELEAADLIAYVSGMSRDKTYFCIYNRPKEKSAPFTGFGEGSGAGAKNKELWL